MVNFLLCLISYFKWLLYIVLLKMLFMALVCTTITSGQLVWVTAVHDKLILCTVRYATMNDPKMNKCYNEHRC